MINSRLLTLFAALVASAPADCYGFLIATKCTNVSDDCANVPEIMPNLALRPNLASMRDPHELNSHRGGAPPRRNSWHFDNLFDSDLIQVPSQGDVASSALAWAKRLVHIAGPSCPYGYSVTLGSYSAASADNVKALVLDQLFLLENHTPTRGPTSGMFILSKSTALIIPLRHNADMMIGRRIAGPEAVIFLHRGALDECFDFERLPPRSPSSDARRERRLARRIRNWYRTVGARIIGHRRTKTMSDQLEEIHSSRKRWQQRVEFLIADLPEYASAVEKWAHDAVPHRLAVTVATSVTAVTRFTAATVFTLCGIYTDTVVNAVSVECKTKVYNAIRISAELLVELLPQLWLSAREGACDLVENMLLPVNFVITLVMWLPTVLCYYALAPSWCKFKQYHRAVVAYEAAVLKTQALFVAENVALANGRQLIDRPFPISMPVLRSAANQARFSRTCRLVGRAADRDVDYFREHLQIPPAPPSWFEQLVSLCLIALFENALPASYAQVRQMLRYRKHTDFEVYYQDILEQVKAEVKSVSQPALGAFAAQGGRRDGGRTNPNQTQGGGLGLGANPCFNCGATTHTRDKCPDPKVKCGHCGGGHMSSLCPKGPGSALRDSLSAYAKRALARSVKDKRGKEDKDKGGAHSVQAPPASSSTVALQTPDEAQLAAQFRAYRAGKAAAAAGRAGASSSSSSSAPPAQPVAPEGLAEPDEMEEFMSAINRTTALIAARRDYHKALLSSPPVIRRGLLSAVACVDSQASSFVVPSVDYLLRVTDAKPSFTIATANGDTYPVAIGVAGVHLQDESGRWHYFEVDGVIVLPQCDRVLYSWPTMARAGVKHMLDDNYLLMPNGGRVPVSTGLTVEASFGPPPAISAHPATIGSGRSSDHEGDPVRGASSAPSKTGRGSDSAASVPQSLLWQRLGFPSEHAWRHSREVIIDHGLPSSTSLRFDFGVVDAVARARTRSLPFHKLRDPSEVPAPGAVLYLDYAGPLTASYPHKFEYYCGVVDAGSGFSRLFACHGPTKEVAKRAMETLLADISALMGLTHALKPQVVVTDQGSAFMSKYFSDFLADSQVRHWPSTAYTPQQNAYVERMWGTRFSMARALLAHANLGPSWHPWALQTANWILNRLPQPSRGNLSSYFILSRAPASVAYLRTFGCLVRVLVPLARRDGDRHFADRGRLGICLGPSEACPGACVYIPSTRTFVVSREVVFYEDTLPGVKGVDAAWRDVHASSGDEGAGGGGALPTPSGFVSPSLPHVPPHPSTPPPAPTVAPAPAPAPSPSPPTQAAAPTTPAFEVAPTAPAEPDLTVDNGLHVLPEQQQSKYFQRGLGPIPVKRERKQAVQHNVSTFKGKSYAANSQFIDPTTADQQGAIHNCVLLDDLVYAGHPTFVYEGTIGGLSAYKAVQTSVVTNLGDIPIPRGYRQALEGRWSSYWREAICKELNGLMGRGTWHYVYLDELPEGTNIMGCHMVFTVKRLSDGAIEKFKCRLVANGNTQKEGVDFDRIFSTVVKITTIRVVLAISAARDYNLTSIDVQQAFLHGKLEEDLYMQMPPGLPSRSPDGRRIVVKLDRSIYGLKQAGRVWWQLFTGFLLEWGFKQSSIDVCFYTYTSPTGSILWLLVWVDDTIIVDDDEGLRERFVTDLGARFPIDDKHELEWILGVKVSRNRKSRTLTLSQELYVQDLCKRHASLIDGLTKRFDSPADPKIDLSPEQSPEVGSPEWERMQRYRADYMALIGACLWLANVTRPELSFIASRLARFVSNPGAVHYSAAIRVLIYLQGSTSRVLHFRPTATRPLRIFVDSDWATKFSVSGAVFEVMGCAVHWFSKTQRSVSLSSTEAEWFAAMVAAREGMYFRDLLTELGISLLGATALRSDNKSVKELSLDSIAFKKTKHILRAAHFLRDLCDRQFFQVIWIAGTQNPADLLTKVHDLSTFRAYVSLLDHLDGIE